MSNNQFSKVRKNLYKTNLLYRYRNNGNGFLPQVPLYTSKVGPVDKDGKFIIKRDIMKLNIQSPYGGLNNQKYSPALYSEDIAGTSVGTKVIPYQSPDNFRLYRDSQKHDILFSGIWN
jgi:hypothetical protein